MSRCVASWPVGALIVGVMTLAAAAEGAAMLGESALPAVDFVEPVEQPVGPLMIVALLICAAIARPVFTQTYGNFELIVVDDGSTDDTVERLRRIGDRRLSIVTISHGGVSAARNAGIAVASGALIALLESDDLWLPHKLASEVDFLVRHPEVGVVFGDLEKYDGVQHVGSFMRTTDVFGKPVAARRRGAGHAAPRCARIEGAGQQPRGMTAVR